MLASKDENDPWRWLVKAILLAGGEGTRLKAVTGDLPKPMVPLLGRPLMEHILRLLQRNGFTGRIFFRRDADRAQRL